MSLVFLKNRELENSDDNQESRPHYRWTNNFSNPLKLPPNAQVAYIQSTIALAKSLSISSENNVIFLVIGNPNLNPTMRIPISTGQPQNPAELAQVLNSQLNTWGQQALFKTTEQTITGGNVVNNNGFNCIYDALALKFNYACKQRKTNILKEVGYNISKAGLLPLYSGTSQLGMYRNISPNQTIPANALTWLAGTALPPPAPSLIIGNIGFNSLRVSSGQSLPGITAANLDIINRVITSAIEPAEQGIFGMWCSNTGIKKAGLSNGTSTATDFSEVLYATRENPNAFPALTPGSPGVIPHFAGLCPRYWLESTAVEPVNDTTRQTHLERCDVNVRNGTARYLFGHRIDCDGGTGLGRVVAQINTGSYENPVYNDVGGGIDTAILPVVGADPVGHTTYKYVIINTYQVSLWACRDYDQKTGDSTAGWQLVYNFSDGSTQGGGAAGSTWACPSWFGDLCLTGYPVFSGSSYLVRGNFDLIKSFEGTNTADGSALQPFPYTAYQPAILDRTGAIRTGTGYFDGTFETTLTATGYAEKEMYIVHNPTKTTLDLDQTIQIPQFGTDVWGNPNAGYTYPLDPFLNKFFSIGAPQTSLGYELGFGEDANQEITTGAPTQYEQYKATATSNFQTSKNVNSVHLQLSNLPIQSKNAMIQGGVKDIAVVPCYDALKVNDDVVNNTDIYHHQVGEKNWIDLNNIQTLYLNNLDVYITYDNNTPAYGIKDETDILVMFRQKPNSNTSLPLNIGTIQNQNPYQQTIQEI